MNINSLPDVVLRHIFSHLPLPNQLYLHHVCPKWQSLQFGVTSTRKCLTLFVGARTDPSPGSLIDDSFLTNSHLNQIETDSARENPSIEYSVTNLNSTSATHLVSLFPRISSLCLVLNRTDYATVDRVIQLLESWSKSLTSLSFYCRFDALTDYGRHFNKSSNQLFKLIDCINRKCLLMESLTFDVGDSLYGGDAKLPNLDLPCLGRLREFKFFSHDDAAILFRSLKQYGNDQLERVTIGNLYFGEDVLKEFAQHPKIAAKFVALPHFRLPQLRKFYNIFNSLTTLWFELGDLTLPELTIYLAPLHSLLHLQLVISNDADLSQYDATPTYEFHRLASVKILNLVAMARKHDELASRHWSTIFPSIQHVEICTINKICEACSPIFELAPWNPQGSIDDPPIERPIQQSKQEHCLKMLIAPLKQCDQLKKIVTYSCRKIGKNVDDTREWTIEELK